ncbi:MAG: SUMF1/EgtB/PvdO family nonheme iron enzyme [Gammaproteobacteria bacterium]|nr:MAG: SUMF1/EgtB/PvdO family nonheme iron enzyme [Gammaproteobacteria bacterium]
MTSLITKHLDNAFHQTIETVIPYSDAEWRTQYHPDLSPIAWHVGHVVYMESYWIQQQLLGNTATDTSLKELYFPWLNEKQNRQYMVPGKAELLDFIRSEHSKNMDLLTHLDKQYLQHTLMKNDYLILFLVQHYCQHHETLKQILLQRALETDWHNYDVHTPLLPATLSSPDLAFESRQTLIGSHNKASAYDNEMPQHRHALDNFEISRQAVSNAQYLNFIDNNGYSVPEYWSKKGWRWQQKTRVSGPLQWRQNRSKCWFMIGAQGPADIRPEQAVTGINYYEAEAFSKFAHCRLPTEQEWEHAASTNRLFKYGHAWEWCANTFAPYPNYRAFPYERYSKPWFDGKHFTLRGGNTHTSPWIKRPSFRNFYTADKRHIFSGLRLAK